METSHDPGIPGPDPQGGERLSAAAGQVARDQRRLAASREAVASEVIAFQVLHQRAQLAPAADLDPERVVGALSQRELEVLALLAAGRTDGEIGSELFISKKTASVHVANIKGKLGAASRVEIVVLAARLGLVPEAGGAIAGTVPVRGSRADVVCPFKGLASYDVADGAYFFGRERVVAEAVARLVASSFLAVVGPSGSGKSSVVRAGLVPSLAAGVLPGSNGWPLAVIRPGEHPADALHEGLAAVVDGQPPSRDQGGEAWLERLAPGERLILVVDQFEEVYTVCADGPERSRFLDQLAALARDPGARAIVVVAIRSEFYGRCAEHRALAELVGGGTVLLGPMTADELTRAIELPARAAGLRLDASLVPALVGDVLQQPGALPLLSSTLLELWQRREGRAMRMDSYVTLGGVSGAVGRLAESVFARLTPGEQAIGRSIFLRLATVDPSGVVARRRAAVAELGVERRGDSANVLAVLVNGRLLTEDDGHVEPAHEALLQEWPRMRGWLQDDAEMRQVREHLGRSAREWAASGRDPSELYRGPRLSAATEWAAAHPGELNEAERRFLDQSRAASTAELVRQRRVNVRLRGLLGAAVVLLLVSVGAGLFALRQAQVANDQAAIASHNADEAVAARRDAEDSERLARSRELGASSRVASATDASLGRLLALSAAEVRPLDVETEAVLHDALLADPVLSRQPLRSNGARDLISRLDPAGTRIVTTYFHPDAAEIEVRDLATGSVAWTFRPSQPDAWVDQAFFSSDGASILSGTYWAPAEGREQQRPQSATLGLLVLDAATGRQLQRIDLGPCGGWVAGLGGSTVLVGVARAGAEPGCFAADAGSAYESVDLATGARRLVVPDSLGDAVLSPDGRRVAYTDTSLHAVVVDLAKGRETMRVPLATLPQRDHGFHDLSADGALALFGSRPVLVLDTATGRTLSALESGAGEIFGAAFAHDEEIAYLSGRDAVVRAWDARLGTELFAVAGVPGGTISVASDGRLLVANVTTASAAIVDPRPRGETATVPTCRGFFPGGQLQIAGDVLVASGDCGAERPTYSFEATSMTVRTTMADSIGQSIALSPDGTRVARQVADGPIAGAVEIDDAVTGRPVMELQGTCAWDAATPDARADYPGCHTFPLPPFPFWAQGLRYSPDGSLVVGLDLDGSIVAWSATTGRVVATLTPEAHANSFIFTPDGSEVVLASGESSGLVAYSTSTWKRTRGGVFDASVPGGLVAPIGYVDGGATLIGASGFSGPSGGWVHRIDPATLVVQSSARASSGSLKSASLDAASTMLATGASDGTVRVWDVDSLALLHALRVPGQAQGVAFVDAAHLAVLPERGDILVMTLDRSELLRLVRQGATRAMTSEECDLYGIDPCPTLDQVHAGP